MRSLLLWYNSICSIVMISNGTIIVADKRCVIQSVLGSLVEENCFKTEARPAEGPQDENGTGARTEKLRTGLVQV